MKFWKKVYIIYVRQFVKNKIIVLIRLIHINVSPINQDPSNSNEFTVYEHLRILNNHIE